MSKDTSSKEGDCEIASFDSSLPQIEKWVIRARVVLAETIISFNFIRRKGDRHFLGCTTVIVRMDEKPS
ncbi:hypothetical protein J1N35_037365 [Gossypium stocksii]|uniref:Uncharacterized protein n=1 Tax=Gossypium stocksii TaxID=47602 RepID=A0A9D3UJJ4_9ROSI|nr:hypothetical protein J1N35_037365 [Gossypium stocksii]